MSLRADRKKFNSVVNAAFRAVQRREMLTRLESEPLVVTLTGTCDIILKNWCGGTDHLAILVYSSPIISPAPFGTVMNSGTGPKHQTGAAYVLESGQNIVMLSTVQNVAAISTAQQIFINCHVPVYGVTALATPALLDYVKL